MLDAPHLARLPLLLALVACTGAIEGETGAPTGTDGPGATGGDGGGGKGIPLPGAGGMQGTTYAPLVPAPAAMLRLTTRQYTRSVADVFGADVKVTRPLETDERSEAFSTIGAAKVATSERGVEQYRDAALEVAAQVISRAAADPALAACATAGKASDPCVASIIKRLGLRLWRRPLGDDEVVRYAAIVGADGEGVEKVRKGLEWAIAGLLQSPHFLYVATVGEHDDKTGALRLTGHELASRLSYLLWDSTPDEALLAAAPGLTSDATLAAQVTRMLEHPRARELPVRFLGEAWKVARLEAPAKNPAVFPAWNEGLVAAYKQELERVVEDAVFTRRADLRSLFDARETFVDATLAKAYGLPAPASGFAKVALADARAGLLTSGAVIAANSPSDRTSPTHRGVFVRERLLCEHVPPPPPNVNDQLPTTPEGGKPKSIRASLEQHRTNPTCAACHAFFDPIGLAFEHFDGIGLYRTTDAGEPIDARGELDGRAFTGVRELGAALRADARAGACFAQQFFAFGAAHEITPGEEGAVKAITDQLAAGNHELLGLVRAVVLGPAFRYAGTDR